MVDTLFAVQAWELHSSSGASNGGSALKFVEILSCPNLKRFDDGLGFVSCKEFCRTSNKSSSISDDWDIGWRAEVDRFHTTDDSRVFRFLEILRIGGENASKKGYVSILGKWNLMRKSLFWHLEESWNGKEKSVKPLTN